MSILIKGGRVIDPANKIDSLLDVLVEGDKIAKVAEHIAARADTEIDAQGKIVAPGIVDMHVHLREPGREDKETVLSATTAAAKGGVTTVLAMPNTSPAIDSAQNISLLKGIIEKGAKVNVLICAAITRDRLGKELNDIPALNRSGAVAVSDDGSCVEDEALMSEALLKARGCGILTICHCEDRGLSNKGVVNLGLISTRLGLRGIPKEAEYRMVARDVSLAQKLGAAVHIAHVSCAESVELIAKAKKQGARVSCETAPHYFSLTEEALLGYDTNMKMNPPLRGKDDLVALKQGLKQGVIDAIASDHAPHTENEKDIEFERAEFGVIGLETVLAASITELLGQGGLNLTQLVEKLCLNPSLLLGIDRGTLSEARSADIVVFSPEQEWVVEKSKLVSKSKNSAFLGRKLKGIVEYTVCNGRVVYNRQAR